MLGVTLINWVSPADVRATTNAVANQGAHLLTPGRLGEGNDGAVMVVTSLVDFG